jgi:hypothetical protein
MAYLSRFVGGGFVAGAKLYASQLNGELDNLIDALVGTDNKNIKLKYNAGDNPTLEVWNSGGNVIEFHVGAGDDLKLHVDSSGTLISAVTTGTAPITVASTTVATNLNADFIDGKHLTSLVQSDIAVNTITAAAAEVSLELEATGQGADAGKAVIYFDMRDTANNVDAWWRLVGHGDDTFPLQQVATTKSRTMAQIGAFYEGVIATAAKQATFIASDDSEGLVFTKAKYVFRGGTLVGNTVIEVRKYSNATPPVLNQTVTLTLPNTDTIGNVYTVDTTDMNVAAGESIQWVVTTADLHEDLSVWMIGEQEIKTD